jgi:hypothetical protein
MTFSPAEWELLTSANEDWHGLWEGLAGVRSAVDGLEDNEVPAVTRAALLSLLDKDLVYLCWFRHQTNEEQLISKDESKLLIEDPKKWEPPDWGDRYVAFAATSAGERVWKRPSPTSTTPGKRNRINSPR